VNGGTTGVPIHFTDVAPANAPSTAEASSKNPGAPGASAVTRIGTGPAAATGNTDTRANEDNNNDTKPARSKRLVPMQWMDRMTVFKETMCGKLCSRDRLHGLRLQCCSKKSDSILGCGVARRSAWRFFEYCLLIAGQYRTLPALVVGESTLFLSQFRPKLVGVESTFTSIESVFAIL